MQTTAHDYARLLEGILQAKNLSRAAVEEMLTPQVAITSERMFGPGIWRETEANKHIRLSWCLGWGRFDSEHGRAFFHTGHEFGFQNYTVTYADAGIGVVLLSNSDNFESVAREIVTAVIGPDESPFDWLGYPRFDPKTKKHPLRNRRPSKLRPEYSRIMSETMRSSQGEYSGSSWSRGASMSPAKKTSGWKSYLNPKPGFSSWTAITCSTSKKTRTIKQPASLFRCGRLRSRGKN